MKLEELIVLLPCHSLEDFPVHQEGDDATGLLGAWSALWHPALLANAGRLPTWNRADCPPSELAGRLLIIPKVSERLLTAGWATRAQSEGAILVRKLQQRQEIVAAALAATECNSAGISTDLAADFLALGYCYLMVELLTRQMRYMSNIDEIHLRNEALAAARAAVEGQQESAREHLGKCFEVLQEARERFYPVQAYLVDLTLVCSTTIGASLRSELESGFCCNLLLGAETVAQIGNQQPETLAAIRKALDRKTVGIVGGDFSERELPLAPIESILAELERGRECYQRWLGQVPQVYGRRRFGLSPVLPQILSRMGFSGALHFTLDDGQFPQGGQNKTRWEGLDTSAIDCLTRVPMDAAKTEAFLSLSRKLGESMDADHVAGLVFAHWPAQTSPYYGDLKRMAKYAPALGKFVTLDEFFASTDRPGQLTRYKPDQYRAPYLQQAIIREQANPLSACADHHRRRALAEQRHAMQVLAALLGGACQAEDDGLFAAIDQAASAPTRTAKMEQDLDQQIASSLQSAARQWSAALGAKSDTPSEAAAREAYLVLNPSNYARQVVVPAPGLAELPDVAAPIQAVQKSGVESFVALDVPAMGFAWIRSGRPAPAGRAAKARANASTELTISNEFLTVTVHAETGGIRSIYHAQQRANRMSQQLAFRLPAPRPQPGEIWRDPDAAANYSRMVADKIEITMAGPVRQAITSQGKLLAEDGRPLATFVQRLQLDRASRVVELDIELETQESLRADPWNSYYCSRFAWSDAELELHRSVSLTRQPTDAKRIEAPHFVELRSAEMKTSILTGGLPYHRLVGTRMLDTLLVVRGESRRRFRLGIGAELASVQRSAMDLLAPVVVLPASQAPGSASSGWLFHVDVKNLVASHWEVVTENGRACGFRVRLLETEGRGGRATLNAFRGVQSARQVDFAGNTLVELLAEGDKVTFDFVACEWVYLEARWAPTDRARVA